MSFKIRLASVALALCALTPLVGAAPASPGGNGKVFLTVDEALALAFPNCIVERTTTYLSKAEQKLAGKLAGNLVERRVVYAYVAKKAGKLVGTAYFDTHRVRSLRETLMVIVDPKDAVKRIEILAFAEPTEYLPRGNWYGQFVGKKLNADLSLKRGIRGVTGATLTARATTSAARRVLALHEVVARRARTSAAQ